MYLKYTMLYANLNLNVSQFKFTYVLIFFSKRKGHGREKWEKRHKSTRIGGTRNYFGLTTN